MKILGKIVDAKRAEVAKVKTNVPVSSLEKSEYFRSPARSLQKSLLSREGFGILAEFKKKSPSKGLINAGALPENVCPAYFEAGASAVSVLTNREFFGGSNEDFLKARKACKGVLLRKEFIIDEYQVIESKSLGADAILLIADILTKRELTGLSTLASSLGMEVLFEIHDEKGIEKLPAEAKLTGINSRNLDNFSIDMDIPARIIRLLPETSVKIAESGIHSPEKLMEFRKLGFSGFLIGEMFMKENDPGDSCRRFTQALKQVKTFDKTGSQ